jgi:hypothetical protein
VHVVKKPVRRGTLLEDTFCDLMEAEDILSVWSKRLNSKAESYAGLH